MVAALDERLEFRYTTGLFEANPGPTLTMAASLV
jgi:hypothetical protein